MLQLTGLMPALAGPCTAVLSGCASAPPVQPVRDFTPLLVTPGRLAAAQLSPESHFEGLTGAQVEARTRALADVQVGHFQGVPSGWLARPVRIYFRVYAHKNEARGGIVLVPGFTEGLAHHQ